VPDVSDVPTTQPAAGTDVGSSVNSIQEGHALQIDEWYPKTSEAEIRLLEAKLGAKLPTAYRDFMLKHNGGSPRETQIDFVAPKLRLNGGTLNNFFCIGGPNGIEAELTTRGDLIPSGMIFIGRSPGGDYFLMSLRPQSYGQVFYKDHEFEDHTEFDEQTGAMPESTVKIADSFEDFVAKLFDGDA
jgi:SMI1 / KNR4 family (SUKH-1)